jgi:hypothetical protein
MSSILSQSDAQVFACPKCGEMINTSMAQCAYCSAPVDPQWAAWAAGAQATLASAFNILKAAIIYGGTIIAWPIISIIWVIVAGLIAVL